MSIVVVSHVEEPEISTENEFSALCGLNRVYIYIYIQGIHKRMVLCIPISSYIPHHSFVYALYNSSGRLRYIVEARIFSY
jgi:hypothetical protein